MCVYLTNATHLFHILTFILIIEIEGKNQVKKKSEKNYKQLKSLINLMNNIVKLNNHE